MAAVRHAQPLQHLLVVFLFRHVMNSQAGKGFIGSARIVLEEPHFRRPALAKDFRSLHGAVRRSTAQNHNSLRPLESVADDQPSTHLAEGPDRRASHQRQRDQQKQHASCAALNRHACPRGGLTAAWSESLFCSIGNPTVGQYG